MLDIAIKEVGQAISIHEMTLEEAAKTVWDSVIGKDAAKLILTANATTLKTEMTHAEVMGLKEALDETRKELMEVKNDLREARNELMEVKNDMREVKAVVGPLEMMGRKAKLFLNGEKLKVEELNHNAHQKKMERRSEKLSLKAHHTREMVPKKIRTVLKERALLTSLLAITVGQTVLDMAMKEVG
nr:hypothetical protein CFP56_41763 [Quercus suber]